MKYLFVMLLFLNGCMSEPFLAEILEKTFHFDEKYKAKERIRQS